jgi:site-specific DNA-cytosine methylase
LCSGEELFEDGIESLGNLFDGGAAVEADPDCAALLSDLDAHSGLQVGGFVGDAEHEPSRCSAHLVADGRKYADVEGYDCR